MAKLCALKDAVPTAWPSRLIPYSLQSAVNEEIGRIADDGIIISVDPNVEENQWATPLIGNNKSLPTHERTAAITHAKRPAKKKKLRTFLGLANYHSRLPDGCLLIQEEFDDISEVQSEKVERLELSVKTIPIETSKDNQLTRIKRYMMHGDGARENRNTEGTKMSQLRLLHEGHPGESAMKSLSGYYIWWPTVDKDIDDHVATFFPFKPGGRGCRSKWPEVWKSVNWNTSKVTAGLDEAFARWGVSRMIVSENGPQSASSMFNEWSAKWGISHAKTSHPQTNGFAERFIGTITNSVLKHGNNWAEKRLNQFLLCYRNTTHISTGKSPAEIMIRRRLPHVLDNLRSSLHVHHERRTQLDHQYHDGSSTARWTIKRTNFKHR
ncbi:hypothetical protein GJ496_000916 [Pomphorhynchus laevis]|nr:hypothetical protein GJ496_000916 [Pomphorhynchus laevis]